MPKSDKDVLYGEVYGSKLSLPYFYDANENPVEISTENPLPVTGSGSGGGGMRFISGEGAPGEAEGQPGDVYLDTSSGDLYTNNNGSWAKEMNLKGPQGDPGDDADPQFTDDEVTKLKELIADDGGTE